jgi:hypothetical protein
MFSLVVDDFGVKYVAREHVDHLLASIEQHYMFSKEWKTAASTYNGTTKFKLWISQYQDTFLPRYTKFSLSTTGNFSTGPINGMNRCTAPIHN